MRNSFSWSVERLTIVKTFYYIVFISCTKESFIPNENNNNYRILFFTLRLKMGGFSQWFCTIIMDSYPTDDGPYSKGNKDSTGPDNSLISRRQSIPGTPNSISSSVCAHTNPQAHRRASHPIRSIYCSSFNVGIVFLSFPIRDIWVLLATLTQMGVWDWGLRLLLTVFSRCSCGSWKASESHCLLEALLIRDFFLL